MGKSEFSHIGVTKRQPRPKARSKSKPANAVPGGAAAGATAAPLPRYLRRAAAADAAAAAGGAEGSDGATQGKQILKTKKKKKKKKTDSGGAAPAGLAGAAAPTSNWEMLQRKLGREPVKRTRPAPRRPAAPLRHFKARGEDATDGDGDAPKKKKSGAIAGTAHGGGKSASGKRYLTTSVAFPVPRKVGPPTDVLGIDCEMVGVGPTGETSALARVSIVNSRCEVVYDTFVRPPEKITDFRTKWSGVTPEALKGARTFKKCQEEVSEILDGRTIVGHAVNNDFDALLLSHPKTMIRDTAHYRPLMRQRGKGTRFKPKALRKLASEVFGMHSFQQDEGGHDSIDDAAMAMELYKVHRHAWEKNLSKVALRMEKFKAKKRAAMERNKEERKKLRASRKGGSGGGGGGGGGGDPDEEEEDALFGF